MRVTVNVQGLNEFKGTLEQAAGRVEGLAGKVVRKTALDVQAEAVSRAPWDTGALRNSIQVKQQGALSATVAPGVNYAVYLELGTSRMGPRPYLFPALEAKSPPFVTAMGKVAEVALK